MLQEFHRVCQCPIFMSVIEDVNCVGHCVLCSVYVPYTVVVGCYWFVQCMRVYKYCTFMFSSVLAWVVFNIYWMVFVVLNVFCKFVCLNKLVIVHMVGLKHVNVVLSFVGCDVVGQWVVMLLLLLLSLLLC